jgi:hypothetical protein
MKNTATKMRELAEKANSEAEKQNQTYVENNILPIIERTARKGKYHAHIGNYEIKIPVLEVSSILVEYGFRVETYYDHITIYW